MHAAKWKAVVQEIARFHKKGRPILVGTTSVESSELLAGMLREQGAQSMPLSFKLQTIALRRPLQVCTLGPEVAPRKRRLASAYL